MIYNANFITVGLSGYDSQAKNELKNAEQSMSLRYTR